MLIRSGQKGIDLEEALKLYFWRAGYFVVRGVPFRLDDEDITDIDLWLYERPAALTRRRLIVDIKNRKSPKAAERIIWAHGLQKALAVDGAIVATTDRRASARQLSAALDVTLLDGEALSNLVRADDEDAGKLSCQEFDQLVKLIDEGRHSTDWRKKISDARESLISGMGAQSTNTNLAACGFFAEQAISAHPGSQQAQIALRLFCLTAAFAAISLDYLISMLPFRSPKDRRAAIIGSIRFGEPNAAAALTPVRAAIGLARKYAVNGNSVAKQIEFGFFKEADQIPAEIIADLVARPSVSESLFNVARELGLASFAGDIPYYDRMSAESKSVLGAFLDFNAISREKIALAGGKRVSAAPNDRSKTDTPGPLFNVANGGPEDATGGE